MIGLNFFWEHKIKFLPAIILTGGVIISAIILASSVAAQTSTAPAGGVSYLQNITFPIPELGNCANEGNCRSYCNDSSHIEACVSFAEAHGLMSKDESEQAKNFSVLLKSGKTPGGCKNQEECQAFCSDINHIDACMAFAKKLGIEDEHTVQGEKISAYLKSGGKMPGGCTSKDNCETYCSNVDHSDECLAFAENAGLGVPPDAVGPDGKPMTFDELKKLTALMKNGEAPGGCKNKDECESYCEDSSHLNACISFAEKAGFITPEQANLARKTGGKGPGDCDSEDSCQSYCNDSSHQQECFNFAKEHGLIPADKLQEMQQGIDRLKTRLNQAPTGVVSCLKSSVGENVLNDILAGKLLPGPDIGDRVQSCFEKFAGEMGPGGKEGVEYCNAHPDECEKAIQGGGGEGLKKMQETWDSFPPAVQDCLKQTLGTDRVQKILEGEGTTSDATAVPEAINTCVSQMPKTTPPSNNSSSSMSPEENSVENSGQIPQEYCSSFAAVPNCSYVGSPDSDNYKYCKQCFPNK